MLLLLCPFNAELLGPVNPTGVGGVVDENRPRLGGGRGLRLFPGEDDNEVWADFPDFCVAPRWETPGIRRSSLLELEKTGPGAARPSSVNRP